MRPRGLAGNAVGTGLSNYLIYYNAGTLNVTPAPLTITANDQATQRIITREWTRVKTGK
mgnify:CR=1 FL=1